MGDCFTWNSPPLFCIVPVGGQRLQLVGIGQLCAEPLLDFVSQLAFLCQLR